MNREIEIIKYLLDEIQEENDNKKKYNLALKLAKTTNPKSWWNNMPKDIRQPNKTTIKDNAKKIRKLMLKIYKEVE
jgi:hypothetical protein